jgi:hypothetical protein
MRANSLSEDPRCAHTSLKGAYNMTGTRMAIPVLPA